MKNVEEILESWWTCDLSYFTRGRFIHALQVGRTGWASWRASGRASETAEGCMDPEVQSGLHGVVLVVHPGEERTEGLQFSVMCYL